MEPGRCAAADPKIAHRPAGHYQFSQHALTSSNYMASVSLNPLSGAESGRWASVICYAAGNCPIVWLLMTHFPQPHPSRRAARVQLGDSVLAAIRLEDGRRTKAKLQTISVTGGLLRVAQSLAQGDFVEVAFQTQSGPVHAMAEVLTPQRKTNDGILQPFRFVAIEDEDHRRLRTSLDHVVERNLMGLRSSAFSTY
jgi:PilZ domain